VSAVELRVTPERALRAAATPEDRLGALETFARQSLGLAPRGWAPAEVEAARRRLDVRLSPPVTRWMTRLADTFGFAHGQNHARSPRAWTLGERGLVFLDECQDNWRLEFELEGADPAVHATGEQAGLVARSFSAFAVQHAIFEAVMTADRGAANGPAAEGARDWLRANFGPPLGEPLLAAGPGPLDVHVSPSGLALFQSGSQAPWIFLARVPSELARRAPVLEWVLEPEDLQR